MQKVSQAFIMTPVYKPGIPSSAQAIRIRASVSLLVNSSYILIVFRKDFRPSQM